jgi:hypothetical protein
MAKLGQYEIAVKIVASGKIQIVDRRTAIMAHIWLYAERKPVAAATYTETHVTVDGHVMSRARIGEKFGPRIGKPIWMVSKIQRADGSYLAFEVELLDERNI